MKEEQDRFNVFDLESLAKSNNLWIFQEVKRQTTLLRGWQNHLKIDLPSVANSCEAKRKMVPLGLPALVWDFKNTSKETFLKMSATFMVLDWWTLVPRSKRNTLAKKKMWFCHFECFKSFIFHPCDSPERYRKRNISEDIFPLHQGCPKFLPGGPRVAGWISVGPRLTTILAAGRFLFILRIKPRGLVKIWSRAAFRPLAGLWTCLLYMV